MPTILMAAFERERSGLGQKLDVCLYDCALTYLHPHAAGWLQAGVAPVRSGNQHPSIAPYEEFATKTVPMFLGVGNDRQFRSFCEFVERPAIYSKNRRKPWPEKPQFRMVSSS
jgi:crotonobetainyl-CoA:carnitine CoA-transferase CaiB-like acyl-CoA transferase